MNKSISVCLLLNEEFFSITNFLYKKLIIVMKIENDEFCKTATLCPIIMTFCCKIANFTKYVFDHFFPTKVTK